MSRQDAPRDRIYLPEDVDLTRLLREAYALSSYGAEYVGQRQFGPPRPESVDEVLGQMPRTTAERVLFRAGRVDGRDVMLTVFRDEKYSGLFFVNPHWLGHPDGLQDALLTGLGVSRETIAAARAAPRTHYAPPESGEHYEVGGGQPQP